MGGWRSWLLIVSGLVLGALYGAWWGQTRIVAEAENARLEIDPRLLDLGEVWEQRDFPWTVSLRNPTSRDLRIERFAISCGCTRVAPESLTIPARQSVDVRLTLDLTSLDSSRNLERSRPIAVRFVPVVAGNWPPLEGWTLRGKARRPYRVTPSSVDFGETLIAGQPFEPQLAFVTSEIPLARLAAETDAPDLAAAALEPFPNDDHTFQLYIVPHRSAPVGAHRFQAILTGVNATGESLPAVSVPVFMRVVSDVHLLPSHAALGALSLGAWAEETVVLSTRTGRAVEVVEVLSSEERGTVIQRLDASDLRPSFRLRQQATALGEQTLQVRFRVRDDEETTVHEIALPITYYGTPNDR